MPCIHAGMAANRANQGTLMAVLQCWLYPCLVPLMRNQVRKERGIDVSYFDSFVYFDQKSKHYDLKLYSQRATWLKTWHLAGVVHVVPRFRSNENSIRPFTYF